MNKDKEKQRRQRQAKFESEKATIDDGRRKAPKLKPLLRQVGCDLPFYDYLDSYAEEFGRTVSLAKKQFPSLVGIHEVDDAEFQTPDWIKYAADSYRQVFFAIDERFSLYGANSKPNANIRGAATFFLDGDGNLRDVVLIPRSPPCPFQHKELKYAFKIGSLLHELGHVYDAEQQINIDAAAGRFDLIQAEAYANCYALDKLADRCLAQTYSMLYEGMETIASGSGYEAEIGRLVLERHQRRTLPNWQDYMDAVTAKGGGPPR